MIRSSLWTATENESGEEEELARLGTQGNVY